MDDIHVGVSIASAASIAKSLASGTGALSMVVEQAKQAADTVDRSNLPGCEGYELKRATREFCESATKLEMVAEAFLKEYQEVEALMEQLKSNSNSEIDQNMVKKAVKPLQNLVKMANSVAKETDRLTESLNSAQASSEKLLEKLAEEEKKNQSLSGKLGSFFSGETSMISAIGADGILGILFFAGAGFLASGVGVGIVGLITSVFNFSLGGAMLTFAGGLLVAGAALVFGGAVLFRAALLADAQQLAANIMPTMDIGDTKCPVLDHVELRSQMRDLQASTEELRKISRSLGDAQQSAERQQAEAKFLQQGLTAGLNYANAMESQRENEKLKRELEEMKRQLLASQPR